jgi:mono/diheme cytochrome c family protein
MKRPVLFAALIVFLASAVVAGQHNGDSKEGKKLFLTFCSACHGSGGSGDGEASQFLEKKPRDLTNQRIMFKKTDKELFDFINQSKTNFHGARFIPQFRLEFEESQVWDIVAYIRSLSEQSRGNAINGRGLAVAEGGRSIHGPSIMPQWANRLSPDQTWDVVAYLRMLHRRPEYSGDAGRGSQTFAENCSYCHGGDGKGNTPIAKAFTAPLPDFTNRSQMASWTELDIYIAILGGGDAVGHSEFMPSWGEVLSDNDIWNLVAFIKSLKNNPAP